MNTYHNIAVCMYVCTYIVTRQVERYVVTVHNICMVQLTSKSTRHLAFSHMFLDFFKVLVSTHVLDANEEIACVVLH